MGAAESSRTLTIPVAGIREEGSVALSLASPLKRPPQEVWRRIERRIGAKSKFGALTEFWANCWRNGWAAAAACLVGWLLYAVWVHRTSSSWVSSTPSPSVQSQEVPGTSAPADPNRLTVGPGTESFDQKAIYQLLRLRTQEIGTLSWQIVRLTNRIAYLSQTVTQQQALLSDPARLKFFQILSPGDGALAAQEIPANLQRALLLAMSRELKWTPSARTEAPQRAGADQRQVVTQTNQVDFVDLRPSTNILDTSISSHPAPDVAEVPDPSSLATVPGVTNAIPGFTSGSSAVIAMDSSIVPVGSTVWFWRASSLNSSPLGGGPVGVNPVVFTVPITYSGSGGTLIIGTILPNGQAGVLGQHPVQNMPEE